MSQYDDKILEEIIKKQSRKERMILCEKCGNNQRFAYCSSIGIGSLTKELKDKFMEKMFKDFVCEKCGWSKFIEYDFLYHDLNRRLGFWLKYPNKNGEIRIPEALNKINDLVSDITEEYVFRIVPSYSELLEKIRIFDDGYDDFRIELLKLLVCFREKIDITEPFIYLRTEAMRNNDKFIVLNFPSNDKFSEIRYSVNKQFPNLEAIIKKLPPLTEVFSKKWI